MTVEQGWNVTVQAGCVNGNIGEASHCNLGSSHVPDSEEKATAQYWKCLNVINRFVQQKSVESRSAVWRKVTKRLQLSQY